MELKRAGFSDESIGTLKNKKSTEIRELRKEWGIIPTYKMVDTCAAEFEAKLHIIIPLMR